MCLRKTIRDLQVCQGSVAKPYTQRNWQPRMRAHLHNFLPTDETRRSQ